MAETEGEIMRKIGIVMSGAGLAFVLIIGTAWLLSEQPQKNPVAEHSKLGSPDGCVIGSNSLCVTGNAPSQPIAAIPVQSGVGVGTTPISTGSAITYSVTTSSGGSICTMNSAGTTYSCSGGILMTRGGLATELSPGKRRAITESIPLEALSSPEATAAFRTWAKGLDDKAVSAAYIEDLDRIESERESERRATAEAAEAAKNVPRARCDRSGENWVCTTARN